MHWNTRYAKLARKSLAVKSPAAGRSEKPVLPIIKVINSVALIIKLIYFSRSLRCPRAAVCCPRYSRTLSPGDGTRRGAACTRTSAACRRAPSRRLSTSPNLPASTRREVSAVHCFEFDRFKQHFKPGNQSDYYL